MSLFSDQNKTELTKQITAATCFWLDARGCKPVENEVSVDCGWIADVASVVCPSNTELQDLKLIRRAPKWSKRPEREAWEVEVKTLSRMMTVIVEVKTARGDFLGDRKWTAPPVADLSWVAVPSGLITESERPQGWGILEYSQLRDCMIHRHPPQIRMTTVEQQRDLIHAVACRRDNHTRYEHINRIRRQYAEDNKQRESLTRVKDAMKAALSIARGEYESVEGALEAHRIKLRSVCELEMLGLTALWNVAPSATPANQQEEKNNMRQQWYCTACDVLASCVIPKGADVYTGVNRLADSHRKWSPKCADENNLGKIRVRQPGTTSEEWEKVRRRN